MKIIILHGDNTNTLYERLDVFKKEVNKRGWEIRNIFIKDNVEEQLSHKSLFSGNVLFILDNCKLLTKKDISFINKHKEAIKGTLTLYSEDTLNKTFLKRFTKIDKVEEYKLPVLIWKLLESLFPGNARNCIKLFHEVIKEEPVEFVFALISRHLRDLYWSGLDENNIPYPSWRVSKLRSQARKYPEGKLKEIISLLSEIDIKVKTGKDTIKDSLDFIFASQLE